jgi:hypothetical protein
MRLQVTNIKVDIISDVTMSIIWATMEVPKDYTANNNS